MFLRFSFWDFILLGQHGHCKLVKKNWKNIIMKKKKTKFHKRWLIWEWNKFSYLLRNLLAVCHGLEKNPSEILQVELHRLKRKKKWCLYGFLIQGLLYFLKNLVCTRFLSVLSKHLLHGWLISSFMDVQSKNQLKKKNVNFFYIDKKKIIN